MLRSLPLVGAVIVSVVAGNLLLKSGVAADPTGGLVTKLLQPYVLLGLALFGTGAMLYLLVLERLPLNVAQSVLALQYVGVMLGSVVVLGEPMPPARVIGAILIAAGVLVVGLSSVP
ncbi:MAG: EamA family transporter [Acetobacteraceae bacterium]